MAFNGYNIGSGGGYSWNATSEMRAQGYYDTFSYLQETVIDAFEVWDDDVDFNFYGTSLLDQSFVYVGVDLVSSSIGTSARTIFDDPDGDGRLGFADGDSTGDGSASIYLDLSYSDRYDLNKIYEVLVHEVGHVVGLADSSDPSSIMYPTLDGDPTISSADRSNLTTLYDNLSDNTTTTTSPTSPASGAISGTTSNDSLVGASTDDSLMALGGDDVISAAAGADTIRGGAGNDIAYGNTEADLLSGGAGNDTLFGGQNNGPASTGSGNASDGTSRQREGIETIYGGSGEDVIYGNYGSDLLMGGDDSDRLFGGQDSDTLSGGAGNDTLYGNRGDDTLVGGVGSDTFVIQTSTVSTVTVNDFTVGEDLLQAAASRTSVTDGGSGALIEFSNGSILTLIGVSSSQVTDSLFV